MRFALVLGLATMMTATDIDARSLRLVSPLKDQQVIDGCSWSASSRALGHGFIYLAEMDGSHTVMNIDGVDTSLALVSEQGHLLKVGDQLDRFYRHGDITVKVHYRATWVCAKGDASCEVTRYDAHFDISSGARRQSIAARGEVGC